jgi:hypothetical protein
MFAARAKRGGAVSGSDGLSSRTKGTCMGKDSIKDNGNNGSVEVRSDEIIRTYAKRVVAQLTTYGK